MEPNGTPHKPVKGLGIGIAVAAVAAVVAVAAFGGSKDVDTTPDTTTTTVPAQTQTTPTPAKPTSATSDKSTYRDGTYTASTSYMSPGGMDQIAVTMTLKSDIVTDVSVKMSGDKTSEKYQAMFASGYKAYVVGKDIDTVKLDKVPGSSLTPAGFNEAVTKIESQAKV